MGNEEFDRTKEIEIRKQNAIQNRNFISVWRFEFKIPIGNEGGIALRN